MPRTSNKHGYLAHKSFRRSSYRSARSFYLILALGLLLALTISLQSSWHGSSKLLRPRDLLALESEDDKCRHVHLAEDQCAFVHKHCPDDDAGFTMYLNLYFCELPHVKPIAFIILTAWLGLLFSTIGIAASDFFCVDLSTMAKILGMSESMAGVTLLAFGNGSPDVFSTFSAMSTNSGDLAVGELMGAAGFITAVVAGSMALIKPFKVSKKSFVRDVCFFAVAAAFTMVILADGILHLWECLAMVGYYVFYVTFVVVWHWYDGRRRKRLDREDAARGHYPVTDEAGIVEPYRDDPDEPTTRTPLLRAPSGDDFAALTRTNTEVEGEGDYDDSERDRWLSELGTNMRLSRPTTTRFRSATIAPVRPSLVGALEFQAVLKSLQKQRNQQHIPMHNRRFSDDPNLTAFDTPEQLAQRRRGSVEGRVPAAGRPNLRLDVPHERPQSQSAYTAREAPAITLDSELQWRGQSHAPIHQEQSNSLRPGHVSFDTPAIQISHHSPAVQPADSSSSQLPSLHHSNHSDDLLSHRRALRSLNSPRQSPRQSPMISPHRGPQVHIPTPPRSRSSTRGSQNRPSPFPAFTDEPVPSEHAMPQLALPSPIVPVEAQPVEVEISEESCEVEERPTRWRFWPYQFLPPPGQLACVLFPTIADWEDKSIWAKALGLVAAPSVFFLTITLPVVESDGDHQDEETAYMASALMSADNAVKPMDEETAAMRTSIAKTSDATDQERSRRGSEPTVPSPTDALGVSSSPAGTGNWPRWLLLIQVYMAPITVVLAIWIQTPDDEPPSWLLKPCLICLLISTVLLIPILSTTTASYRPPQYRIILSLVGFVVSIAWISTIASQVVGTLKALAIILNWSNAIMGLTVFAVGNSVGDLVADVTVANLGYPVMALSACFGGPMLNILLGIGLSGTYSILHGADKRKHKHPEKDYHLKAYHLDVGQTLLISGVALLVTLLGVLLLVPLNKWMMTRKIGVALIVLWILATIGNVVVEVTGIADVRLIR